ncbi:MAG: hypothetical protein H6680_08330 [Desulfobacteraceae bacterium]|nr:hypothetical protein [Desulfobacteraceae bacterium]
MFKKLRISEKAELKLYTRVVVEIPGKAYTLMFRTPKKNYYAVSLEKNATGPKDLYDVSFAALDEEFEPSYELTGRGESIVVFRAVTAQVKALMDHVNPRGLTFSPYNDNSNLDTRSQGDLGSVFTDSTFKTCHQISISSLEQNKKVPSLKQ